MNLVAGTPDLSTMLRPRSIALVGATDRSTWSKSTFANLTTRNYGGKVHLVARRGGIVHGMPAATSCAAIGEPVDLALLMVPAGAIEEAMADLAAAGAHNAVILTSGLTESSHDGAALQTLLAVEATRYGISVLGGIFVEILQDVALRVLPVTPAEVRRMLAELKGAKLLDGQRGIPPADLDAVALAVARIGDAAIALGPALETLEVNPLWVRGARVEALDGLVVAREP